MEPGRVVSPRLEHALPGLAGMRSRSWAGARSDLLAAVPLVALAIPAGMGYATAAGLPPVTGLYATSVPLLVYALVGPSRVLVLAPDSSLAPMIAAAVLPLALGDPDRAVALAGVLGVLVGLVLVLGRVLRLGFVTGLLSAPVRVGYLNGIALIVLLTQLPTMLGVEVDDGPGGLWADLRRAAVDVARGAADLRAAGLGVGALALILVGRALRWRVPGVVVAVVGSAVLVAALGLQDDVPVVGSLPAGLPAIGFVSVTASDVLALVGPAVGVALIAFADTAVLSRAFNGRQGRTVDGSQEMGALGAANLATGLLSGFPVSASASRTPVVLEAGSRSQLTGLTAAALLVVFMVAAPSATAYLPASVLAAVVAAAAASLVDVPAAARLVRISRSEPWLMLAAFVGVVVIGPLEGVVVAIALSLAVFVRRAWDPYRAELGHLDDVPGFHDLSRHPEGRRIPGLVIARFDAPLFFANGEVLDSWIRRLVDEAPTPVRRVVLASEPITGLDTTSLDQLVALDDHLARLGVDLVFAEMKGPVKDKLLRYGQAARFGPDHFFPTLHSAVRAHRRDHPGPDEQGEPPTITPS